MIYIDRETRAEVLVREIENDAQIATWLMSRNALPLPTDMFSPPPHVGEPGEFAVMYAVDGVWQYEVLDADALAEKYESVEV